MDVWTHFVATKQLETETAVYLCRLQQMFSMKGQATNISKPPFKPTLGECFGIHTVFSF